MLDTAFYFILNMSISSCFIIAALLVIRQIRPLPRRVVYPLWLLAFFRLVVPFGLPTRWSLFNFTGGLVKRLITVESIAQGASSVYDSVQWSAMNYIGAAEQYIPVEYRTQSLRNVFTTGAFIWVIIAAAAIIAATVLYLLTNRELKQAILLKDNLFHSDMLISPVLTGLLRPKIILPLSLDPDSREAEMIIAHENVHKDRLDNLWRLFGIVVTCLHWFNPLAWVMLKYYLKDMELSCDEAVIKRYSDEERKVYAGTLLHFAQEQRTLISTAFGQSGVKVRIVNILNYKRMTLFGAVASLLFILAISIVLLTNPQLRG